MAEAHDIYNRIYQNLVDAGCDENFTKSCMAFVNNGRIADMLPILIKYRKHLLDSLHRGQKQINCLDYLIYKINTKAGGDPY